ncbi:GGDEF domain-containing protein [Oceanispirochaeta crateris]|uniref:diguanylate cyclase n=1 Tax=Oceanispirochaeta crateris TaxID=2518645 RepID=A0A5C1QHQ6_9SPIO|nr:GGDEF domain-containing protein [Oceanispirochaeta crateris]QEN07047.1 GGDEF domain-containing protein [Oceanispirochaeta crateris]
MPDQSRFRRIVIFLISLASGSALYGDETQSVLRNKSLASDHLVAYLFILFITTTVLILWILSTKFESRKRFKRLLQNSNETILICNTKGAIKECITGVFWEDSLFDFFEKENHWELEQSLQTVTALNPEQNMKLDLTSLQLEQERYYQLVMQNLYPLRGIRGISVTITDTTESKQLEKRLIKSRETASHEARHDPLTAIPNRLYFNETLSRHFFSLARHRDKTICLLMLDLDFFKKVNDSKGHDVGDLVLIQLSRICTEMIRGADIFARYGGEEFICYLDDLCLKEAFIVAERMRNKIEEYEDWPGGLRLTVSISIAEYEGEKNPEELVKKADIALYNAKAEGRNRVCIYHGEG